MPAEEITSASAAGPVHINGICIQREIPSGRFDDGAAAIAAGVGAIREQRGFPIVNHPNFRWGLTTGEIASLSGTYGLEIASGHPDVRERGDPFHPSHEQIYDELLTRGRDAIAVGVDDMHRLTPEKDAPSEALPGRAWVMTFGGEATRAAICDALLAGRMYVSTGVTLRRIVLGASALTVYVDDASATVDFIGAGGRVLDRGPVVRGPEGLAASYAVRGGESYVRARVRIDGVGAAWTQAYRVRQ